MAIFAMLAALAIHWRRYPETHSRMLMLASIAVAGPALGRLSLNLAGTPLPGVIALMLLPLLVVVHDRVLMKRAHPVSVWGNGSHHRQSGAQHCDRQQPRRPCDRSVVGVIHDRSVRPSFHAPQARVRTSIGQGTPSTRPGRLQLSR
jgi:hypothetical protein